MFARHFVEIPVPFAKAERQLRGRDWTLSMDHGGGELLAAVGIRVEGIPLYKNVQMKLGRPVVKVGLQRIVMPIAWRTAGGPPLFPRLEGHLELEAVDGGSRLTLNATYDPPLGRLGRLLDRAALGRLATASLQDFLERLGAELQREAELRADP